MKSKLLLTVAFVFILLTASLTFGQDNKTSPPKIKGFQAETIGLITFAQSRYIALAKAVPQEKYSYRPGKGVRSFGEILTHMIGANYGLPGVVGVKPPTDAPKNADIGKLTDKKQIIEHLNKSFEHTKNAVKGMSKADLEKDVKFFGSDTTYRGVVSFMNAHTNQHLGNLVTYARVNGIVPPWSQPNNAN